MLIDIACKRCTSGVVTEVTNTYITRVSSGLKKLYMARFCKYKYLHVNIAIACEILCDCKSHSWVANIILPRALVVGEFSPLDQGNKISGFPILGYGVGLRNWNLITMVFVLELYILQW